MHKTSGSTTGNRRRPAAARHERLREAAAAFRRQADWLGGCLFLVAEHFAHGGGAGAVPEPSALTYLEAVPGAAQEAAAALLEVERLAAELRRVMGGEEPGGLCQANRRAPAGGRQRQGGGGRPS